MAEGKKDITAEEKSELNELNLELEANNEEESNIPNITDLNEESENTSGLSAL